MRENPLNEHKHALNYHTITGSNGHKNWFKMDTFELSYAKLKTNISLKCKCSTRSIDIYKDSLPFYSCTRI